MKNINGRYTIKKKVNEGAMGVIYLADDILKKEEVMIKMINLDLPDTPSVEYFKQEFDFLFSLQHPNIVNVYNFSDIWIVDKKEIPPQYYFYSMEPINGYNIKEGFEKIVDEKDAIDVVKQLILTINYIHYHNIVHNDIRKRNIFLTKDNTVKFIDFSISQKLGDDTIVNKIKKANDWNDLFTLLEAIVKNNFPKIKKFIKKAKNSINYNTGENIEKIFSYFNNCFPENEISPALLQYNNVFFLPKEAFKEKIEKILLFSKIVTLKNQVLFLTGDTYTEAHTIYNYTQKYLENNNKILFSFTKQHLMDSLYDMLEFLSQYLSPEREKYLKDAETILENAEDNIEEKDKYILFNTFFLFISNLAKRKKIIFSVEYISKKENELISFINFLINSFEEQDITWIFFDNVLPTDIKKEFNNRKYLIEPIQYDTLSLEEIKRLTLFLLQIDSNSIEYNKYEELSKLIYIKSGGKFVIVYEFLKFLYINGYIKYKNNSYIYNIKEIENIHYKFSLEDVWKNYIDALNDTEKSLLSIIAFYEKAIKMEILKRIFHDHNELNTIVTNFTKKDIISINKTKSDQLVSINKPLFLTYLQKTIKIEEKYKKRLVFSLYCETKKTINQYHFIIKTLLDYKKQYIHVIFSTLNNMLEEYVEQNYNINLVESVFSSEKLIELLPKKRLYNNTLYYLGLFYYYKDNDQKAESYYSQIDINLLSNKMKLLYYFNFAKNKLFLHKIKESIYLASKGNILAKKEKDYLMRVAFFNVKGMIYRDEGNTKRTDFYYDIVYKYVLINGFNKYISNFAANFMMYLVDEKRYKEALEKGNIILKKLDNNKENLKAKLYIYYEITNTYMKLNQHKKALKYAEKGLKTAKDVAAINEMLMFLDTIILIKYYMNADSEILIEDTKKLIESATKYGKMVKYVNAYFNLIETYIETGKIAEALSTFNSAIRLIISQKKNNKTYLIRILNIGVYLFARLGEIEKSKNMLRVIYKLIRENDLKKKEIFYISYYASKTDYYVVQNKFDKALKSLLKKIQLTKEYEKKKFISYSTERIIFDQLELLSIYYKLGKMEKVKEIWENIKDMPNIFKLSYLNINYFRALAEQNSGKKKKYLINALNYTIKNNNYIEIDNICYEIILLFKPQEFEYENAMFLLYSGAKKYYHNIPDKYKQSWLNRKDIGIIIALIKKYYNIKNIFKSDVNKVFHERKKLISQKMDKKIVKITKKINNQLWQVNPSNYLNKITQFLKSFFLAERVIIGISKDFETLETSIKKYNKKLYKNSDPINNILIQNAYLKGDYVIKHSLSFGSPISTLIIPIINPYNKNSYYAKEKRLKSFSLSDYYLGYIYIDTKYPFSNIREESMNFVKIYVEWISMLLMYERVHNELILDKLTKIYNRNFFLKKLKTKFAFSKARNYSVAFIMVDIDNFKQINDAYGHQKGDVVLEKIAEILKKSIRKNDLVGRYGGEEFLIVLFNITIKTALEKAEIIRKKIETSKIIPNRRVTVSMGLSIYPNDGEWINLLINKADSAMYYSKSNGKNMVTHWNNSLTNIAKKEDILDGIITEDLSRSDFIIRTIIEFVDFVPKSKDDLLNEFIHYIKEVIEHKYFYMEVISPSYNFKTKPILFEKEQIENSPANSGVIIDWQHMKNENDVIYYDLFYKFNHKDTKGLILFSIPTIKKEYDESHINLLDKYVKILIGKLAQF